MKSALLVCALLVSVAACKSDSTSPHVQQAGTYRLVKVNGGNLPAITNQNVSIKTEVLSGSLVIKTDGTFSESREGRVTLTGQAPSPLTSTQSGTWVESGGALTFTAGTVANPVTFTGTWTPGTIVLVSSGVTFEYVILEQV